MTDATSRIKNLSIAAERLSRSKHTAEYLDEVLDILADEIQTFRENKERLPPAQPAKITSDGPIHES